MNKTIISAGEDGTVRMWDAETGEQLDCVADEHTEAVGSLEVHFAFEFAHVITSMMWSSFVNFLLRTCVLKLMMRCI